MDVRVVPLHHNWEYLNDCCILINSEWKRSQTARLRTLESSTDKLPTCLILLLDNQLIGHLKLSPIPNIPKSCFIESVVIEKTMRGQGYGTFLMKKAEEYCKETLQLLTIYLSTKAQEQFYKKLGYVDCKPVSIFGNFTYKDAEVTPAKKEINHTINNNSKVKIPLPPPIPDASPIINMKIFLKKDL